MRLNLPLIQIRIAVRIGSRPLELRPPRLSLQRLMGVIVILAAFLAWVRVWEQHRVRRYQESAARSADLARRIPIRELAAEYAQHSQQAAALARPWARGWSDWLLFDLTGFCVLGLLFWLSYRLVVATCSAYHRRT